MVDNRVSAKLSLEDRDAVLAAIATIREKLPFLIDLTAEERRALPKLGDRSRAFVNRALEVATQNPGFLPRSFDLDEMRQDVELFEAMFPILVAMTQVSELIDDTAIAVGSEAYAAALLVYNYAKVNGAGAGLDEVVDEMGRRFARRTRRATTPETV